VTGPDADEPNDGITTGDLEVTQSRPPTARQPPIISAQVGFQQAWAAPLPPPQAFAQYDQVLPGTSERILQMAEKDLDSKIEQDRKVTDAAIEQSKTGQSIASVLALTALVAAIVFFGMGNDVAGGILLGCPWCS
jgi:uncharacterized membrane protein